jgi:hypothetical protein
VWDLPLLPDVQTWGNTITHVVIDNPPRSIVPDARGRGGDENGENDNNLPGVGRLVNAIVANVSRQAHNARWNALCGCRRRR